MLDFYQSILYDMFNYTMIPFYHPSKSGKGSASSFWFSPNVIAIFATLMKQSGWDSSARGGLGNGLFQDNSEKMKVNVKLGPVEVAGIINCIERNRAWEGKHDFGDKPKSIFFTPHLDPADSKTVIGYNFSVTCYDKQDKNYKESFFIRFKLDEARLVREILINLLHKYMESVNKSSAGRSTYKEAAETAKTVATAPAPEPSDSEPVIDSDPLADL